MAKTTTRIRAQYRCSDCGWETAKWVGRCGECQAWGSVGEVGAPKTRTAAGPVSAAALPITEVPTREHTRTSSGVAELDRVLGGGLVPGAAILLAGEPGVGKSTLLLEVAAQTAHSGRSVLYITGEESTAQVRLRAERTGALTPLLFLAAETDLGAVLTHIETVRPELLIVDSVQTIATADIEGAPGGVTQVREVSAALIRVAKTRDLTTLLVGHVTKDGQVAGPRVLEHLVDVVLAFEGERNSRFRMLRAGKNRFGPVDEVGCFDLDSQGITAVADPTGLFVEQHTHQTPGSCVALIMEGRRPMLAEVQALVTPTASERPRRTTSGVDANRVHLILAVLAQHCGVRLHQHDVFVATVGGARLNDPAADLAIALAIVSASLGQPLPTGSVAVGELGLAGEIRRVRELELRLGESARLGFSLAVVPGRQGAEPGKLVTLGDTGLEVTEAPGIRTALTVTGLRTVTSSAAAETNGRARP